MTLRIQTLGGLKISLAGQPLAGLKTRKAQALLVYLACQPGVVFSREHLQGLLWGKNDKKRAAASLRQALSGLRRALPAGMLLLDGLEVTFSAEADCWLDLAHLKSQPESYTGEFLHGFVAGEADLWEEWLYSQRERIRLAALDGLLRRGGALEVDDPGATIPFYQQALAVEPWRESTHRQLMRLFWRTGDRAAALRQYDECCRVLAVELDVEPSAETAELAGRIQSGEDPQTGNLPALGTLTPFVGREEEVAALGDLLKKGRLVTVVGAGGMGKTRLAIEATRRRQNHYPDGVWLVPLDSLEEPGLIAPTIASALGLRFSGSAAPAEQLMAFLQKKRLLLLLDNYEQLLPATGLIADILSRAPDVMLLITSRQRLHLRAEQALLLAGLSVTAEDMTGSESGSADAFFIAAARRVRPDFPAEGIAGVMAAVRRLCRILEGMPLGLELAAAWLRLLSLPQIIAEIESSPAFLAATHGDAPERQQSLEAVFASSWALLNGEEQTALAQLPIFAGGFDLTAWRQIVGAPVHRLLALAEKSLVQREGNERFRLHERLRQYLAEQHPHPSVAAAHSRHFLGLLAGHEQQLSRGTVRQQQAIARMLQPDMENIRAAWGWAIEHHGWDAVEGALESLFALYYQVLNRFEELIGLLALGIDSLSSSPGDAPGLLCRLRIRHARVLTLAGRFDAALTGTQAALSQAEEIGDLHQQAEALARLGHIYQRAGNQAEGVRYCQAALALAETHQWPRVAGDAHNVLGILALFDSDYDRAARHYRQSLALRRAYDSEINAVIALNNLAALVENEEEKVRYIDEVIAVSKAAGDRITWALSLTNRAQEIDKRGEYRKAYEMYREAIGVLEPTGDEWLLGTYVLNNAATSARMMGYLDESNALALRSLSICRRLQAPRGEGMAFAQLGINGMLKNELAAAKEHLQTALAIFAGIGEEWWGHMAARRNWAILCYKTGDGHEAERCFREALALDQAHNTTWGMITDSLWLALLAGEQGDTAQARGLLLSATRTLKESGDWELLAEICVVYGSFASRRVAGGLLHWASTHRLAAWPSRLRARQTAERRAIDHSLSADEIPTEPDALVDWLSGALG